MYGTFNNNGDYMTDLITRELAKERAAKLRAERYTFMAGVGAIALQVLNDIISLWSKFNDIEVISLIKILEVLCKLIASYKLVLLFYKTMTAGPTANREPPRVPPISWIINHPQTYLHTDIPDNSIMDPNDYVQGFARVTQSINNLSGASNRAINGLHYRIDRVEERLDQMEEHLKQRMDSGFATIIALLNKNTDNHVANT